MQTSSRPPSPFVRGASPSLLDPLPRHLKRMIEEEDDQFAQRWDDASTRHESDDGGEASANKCSRLSCKRKFEDVVRRAGSQARSAKETALEKMSTMQAEFERKLKRVEDEKDAIVQALVWELDDVEVSFHSTIRELLQVGLELENARVLNLARNLLALRTVRFRDVLQSKREVARFVNDVKTAQKQADTQGVAFPSKVDALVEAYIGRYIPGLPEDARAYREEQQACLKKRVDRLQKEALKNLRMKELNREEEED